MTSRYRPARKRSGFAKTANAALPAALLLALAGCAGQPAAPVAPDCDRPGLWLRPDTGEAVAPDRLLEAMARRPVVLLGEAHDNAEHHRWQLHVLAGLHARHPDMVLGFESFPRRLQPVLDRWVRGEMNVEAFLDAAEWRTVWGYDADLYLPLFHFARQNRIPMVALNIDRSLVGRVAREGWAAIPEAERAGLSDPAPASADYRESLARVYATKQAMMEGGEPEAESAETDIESIMGSEDFGRFVEAQLTWDRAMAEALTAARHGGSDPLVVGIAGRGHVEYGYGIPHQLADLGIPDNATLLPVGRMADCGELAAGLADAVFVVEAPEAVEKPRSRARLGVLIETSQDGVRVARVMEDSVAAASGIRAGDIVVSAAGFPIAEVGDLTEVVRRQAPGTWLPLTLRRDGREKDILAKFPQSFETPE